MNGQLLCGAGLAASGAGSAVAGVSWLAVATLVAALPFLTAGAALAIGGLRARHEHVTGSLRSIR